jgi:transcriptional regulator with XRE-family HTH domain
MTRERKGMSQTAVAEALSLPRQSIIRIEAGSRGLDVLELVQLAELYDLPVTELLGKQLGEPQPSELVRLSRYLTRRDYERLLSLARSMHRSRNPPK